MDYTNVFVNNRTSITMNDYIKLIKKYIDTSTISTIVDAGSMDGSDALLLKQAFSNSVAYAIEGLPNNYNNYIKDNRDNKNKSSCDLTYQSIHRYIFRHSWIFLSECVFLF
jgi:hypothetical protein